MQVFRVNYGIRGHSRLYEYGLRYARMAQTISKKAEHKARVLVFWKKHGLPATEEAFGVKERTLYYWQALQKAGGGAVAALNEQSKRPGRTRQRLWPKETVDEIRRQRTLHPNLGPEKLYPALQGFCHTHNVRCPSAKTIGRLIADAPDKMRIFPSKVTHSGKIVAIKRVKCVRKPKGAIATYPGQIGSFDTVVRFVQGCRRYVVTFTDVYARFSFAWATTSHGSLAAKEVFDLVRQVFPYPLTYVLTDNGSEFMKHFDAEIRRLHQIHWHTYPKQPKQNAHCERFNRTLQEEFIDYHGNLLLDVPAFNEQLMDYLLWHNGERPHAAHGNKWSPIQFLTQRNPEECKMWWPHTNH